MVWPFYMYVYQPPGFVILRNKHISLITKLVDNSVISVIQLIRKAVQNIWECVSMSQSLINLSYQQTPLMLCPCIKSVHQQKLSVSPFAMAHQFFRHIGVVSRSFFANTVAAAQNQHAEEREYPIFERSGRRRAVFISRCDRLGHVVVFVAPIEPFEDKSVQLGPKLGLINLPIKFIDRDRAGSGSLYHLCLNNDKHPELDEMYLLDHREVLLSKWSDLYTSHWFVGFTYLNNAMLDQLAVAVLYKLQEKYKLTLSDCAEYAKEFGRRVAVNENLSDNFSLSFLNWVTTTKPDGPLWTQAQYSAELSSRNAKPTGETVATSYETRVRVIEKGDTEQDDDLQEYTEDVKDLLNLYGKQFEVPQDFRIYHKTGYMNTILEHMRLAFANSEGEGIVLHLVRKDKPGGNCIFALHTRRLGKTELQQFKLLKEYQVKVSVEVLLNEAMLGWKQFGNYRVVRNNCQTFATEFLGKMGIFVHFYPGFSSNPTNTKRYVAMLILCSLILPIPSAVAAHLACSTIGVTNELCLTIATFMGGLFFPILYSMCDNRPFSNNKRKLLFENAASRGIQVVDHRSKLKFAYDTFMGY